MLSALRQCVTRNAQHTIQPIHSILTRKMKKNIYSYGREVFCNGIRQSIHYLCEITRIITTDDLSDNLINNASKFCLKILQGTSLNYFGALFNYSINSN